MFIKLFFVIWDFIIQKTRKERWYSEDMFVRFKPLKTFGTIKGMDPLAGKV